MPHQSSDSSVDESSYSELHGRPAIIPKITGDVIVPLLLSIA